jgi:DNA-binding XRE family transcriptional regulator
MENIQYIHLNGHEYAVVPSAFLKTLMIQAEDVSDIAAADAVCRRIEANTEELIPDAIVERLLNGENPVRMWREHRGLKAVQLAALSELSLSYLSEIETGKKEGSLSALRKIATALNVDLDDIA